MKSDFHFKFASRDEAKSVLSDYCTPDEESGTPTITLATHDYAVDPVGEIYEPTGVMLTDAQGNEYPESVLVTGWHVNLRILNEALLDSAEAVAAVYGVTPTSPIRVWL